MLNKINKIIDFCKQIESTISINDPNEKDPVLDKIYFLSDNISSEAIDLRNCINDLKAELQKIGENFEN